MKYVTQVKTTTITKMKLKTKNKTNKTTKEEKAAIIDVWHAFPWCLTFYRTIFLRILGIAGKI